VTKRTANKLDLIRKIIEIHGNVYRDMLIDYTGIARSTIFDALKVLVKKELLANVKAQIGLESGRPLSVWTNKVDLSVPEFIWEFKPTKQQEDVLNINKHQLYIHLWGKGTGKTITALRIAFSTRKPTLYIVPNKKEKTFFYYHHLTKFKTIAANNDWKVEKKVLKVAYHGNYMSSLFKLKKEYPEEEIIVILDEYQPNGDIIIKNLLEMEKTMRIKVILFVTPMVGQKSGRTEELLTYLQRLYHGLIRLPYKTISMKTSYYSTKAHLKELKKTYKYNLPPECITEEIYKTIEKNVSYLHFIAKYNCSITQVLKNLSEG